MVLAGETLEAGRMPGERIATAIVTTDSANITTTETVVMTVAAPVVTGRIYRVRFAADLAGSVAGDQHFIKIREDSVSGGAINFRRYRVEDTDNFPWGPIEVEYTADATEDKTFVVTLVREAGTGNIRLDATTSNPAYLYVDYIRG